MSDAQGTGTADDPWQLTTPPGKGQYQMWRDEGAEPPALICQVGGTQLRYHLRAVEDLHAMLAAHGGWMPLGGADEQKPAAAGTVEAWGRANDNPVGGWYGLKKGLRGGSASTCHRCWRCSAWRRSRTRPGTTGFAHSERSRVLPDAMNSGRP